MTPASTADWPSSTARIGLNRPMPWRVTSGHDPATAGPNSHDEKSTMGRT